METDSALIFAKVLNGRGGAHTLSPVESNPNGQTANHDCWLHFDANHHDCKKVMKQHASEIDEYTLNAFFDEEARPRTLVLDTGILVIFRGINYNEGEHAEDMVAVRMWITEHRIISLRYRKSRAVMQVSENLDKGNGPHTIGDIFSAITNNLFIYIENSIEQLDERIDMLESRVVDKPDRQLRMDISETRKSAILLRRYITPQKEAINQLRYADVNWLSEKNTRRLQEAQDLILRGIENLDAIRERSQVVKDELVNALSEKLNRNLYVISVITAIFLPLGFLTGLFGINIGGMPGVENQQAFMLFTGILILLVILQVILFKLFKWF